MLPENDFADPELEPTEDSEIAAAVDLAAMGTDHIFRPIYINQGKEILALTPEDGRRLLLFLRKAIKFLDDHEKRIIQ